jgi:membrane-associated protease RseP (regulator of RpoE activity)
MSRIAPKLLTGVFVLGCGSGAMASPNRGQWTDNAGGDQSQPTQGAPYQGGYPSQGAPSSGGYPQGGYQPPGGYSQGSAAQGPSSQGSQGSQGPQGPQGSQGQGYPGPGTPSQAYPDQGSTQPGDQEDEDFAETEPVESQARLGVMVLSLTPELRRFFGVASDRGVLIARVEPSSAAARAGIQVGDVLVRVGPQVVHAGDDVVQALAARQGGRLRVTVVRQSRPIHLIAFVSNGPNSSMNNQGFQGPQGPQSLQGPQGPQAPQGPMNNLNQGPVNQSNPTGGPPQQNQL